MKQTYSITIEEFEELNSLPESWTPANCRALLTRLEFDGVDGLKEDELRSYAVMSLQDLEPEDAAQQVLAFTLGKLMTAGQIQNLREEMKDDRKWEDSADMRCHEPIFNAQVILSEAFPTTYAVPDIVRITALIEAATPAGGALLKGTVSEPLLVRLLADGMPASAVLKRLFADALETGPFPEASQILWQYRTDVAPDALRPESACRIVLYAPHSWMGTLEDVSAYESDAVPDR